MAKTNAERISEESIVSEFGGKREGIGEKTLGEPEPWESWETKLCLWSIGVGMAALVVLGILVNQFLLS
ncbi:hypothetical protein [Nitrosococcus watsonii]|uniref:Uncharacterized protein n=1 Tax=Nitrosococcus watsoni (strain C-113) TaxID=105559 RepID=D8K623_NITWC|nr:hypothetical protein [Nitrosococcus watsonii]ADJ28350.1 conserved hypothetical protein [Nitrosococcus watsonii C-113]